MLKLLKVTDLGDDVIEVSGFDSDKPEERLTVRGWHSATQNHYDADDYGEDGHLKEDAEPREMSQDEKEAYWLGLLETEHRQPESMFEDSGALKEHEDAVELAAQEAENEST